ELDVI
ncbi:putative transmembrane domain protein, partial [Chlamydia psittaci 06-1683]